MHPFSCRLKERNSRQKIRADPRVRPDFSRFIWNSDYCYAILSSSFIGLFAFHSPAGSPAGDIFHRSMVNKRKTTVQRTFPAVRWFFTQMQDYSSGSSPGSMAAVSAR